MRHRGFNWLLEDVMIAAALLGISQPSGCDVEKKLGDIQPLGGCWREQIQPLLSFKPVQTLVPKQAGVHYVASPNCMHSTKESLVPLLPSSNSDVLLNTCRPRVSSRTHRFCNQSIAFYD
jgi:hypothetical protein